MIQIAHRADMRSRALLIVTAVASIVIVVALFAGIMAARTSALGGVTVVVSPTNTHGWTSTGPLADTRANGSASLVADATTAFGEGALSLVTGAAGTSQDKAQYMRAANIPLSSIETLEYSTKQVSASFVAGLPSFQLPVCLYGVAAVGCEVVPGTTQSSFTTLVYEPYVDKGNAAVLPGVWQTWDVDAGKLWSTRTVAGLVSTQGSVTYSLSDLKSQFPNAVVAAYGVNVGSNNPFYDTRVDGVVVNDVTYDFEAVAPVPATKDQCKNGGWQLFADAAGDAFTNQGLCVAFVTSSRP